MSRTGALLAALVAVLVAAPLVAALVAGCSAGSPSSAPARRPEPTVAVSSLAPPAPSPLSGRLVAELRQFSHSRARGEMQVWVRNGLPHAVSPTRIVYRDPRLRSPVLGERLRTIPSGSERGFPLPLPPVRCGATARPAALELVHAGRTRRLRVTDPTGTVAAHVAQRCLHREVSRTARLRFAPRLRLGAELPDGSGRAARLVLLVEPTGRGDGTVVVQRVTGSHLLSHPDAAYWSPRLRVTATGPATRVPLPVAPSRCDAHGFAEGGGATTFRVHVRLPGRPRTSGQLVLAMPEAGARAALDWAARRCGLPG